MSESDENKNSVESSDLASLKAIYEKSIEMRNFEIQQLLHRNNFFMLFQGVLLAAALQNEKSKPWVEFVICAAGVMVSLYQLQMASGAKFWQEWWESQVEDYELQLKIAKSKDGGRFYSLFAVEFNDVRRAVRDKLEKDRKWSLTNALILRAFSVGRAPIKVSLVLMFAWMLLLLHTIDFSCLQTLPPLIKGFAFGD